MLVIVITVVILFAMWKILSKKRLVTNYQQLAGKVVLITGASSGLGRACSLAFYKHRCKVILCSRNIKELEKVKKDMQFLFPTDNSDIFPRVFHIDLSDVESSKAAIHEIIQLHGSIDILVNNAGISYRGNFLSTKLEVFNKMIQVNFLGQLAVTQAVLPSMIEKRSGHIVGIGSIQGKIAQPFRAPYAASKHACQAFYDSLRAELASYQINVTVINPGYIKTNLSMNALTGDGTVYGKMDATTASGLSVEYVADQVVESVVLRSNEVTIAPPLHKLAIWLRLVSPSAYFKIMEKRAKKEL